MKSAKPIIYLNAMEGIQGKVRIVLKDFPENLKQKLEQLPYIAQQQGKLVMTHDADLVRQLSDYFLDSAWVNTRYLHQRATQVPAKQVSLHARNTDKVFVPTINLLPMQHEGKTYLKLQMRYHKPLYGVLFQIPGGKWRVRYTNILYRVIETLFTLFKSQFELKFRLPCLGKKQR
ncbi:hypothetical protein OKW21_003096 [Catalinimonas alkaloidigena]|uniref:hypothetical protein n=1 Tax=Catalinimonas alkaloidigena TaxID=1075417 RepID=UPI002405A900|nr:hypothetical protein [Catalinimonas alkaloidigena]MDF9797833.1 hypothetical protein [Catalinimonas alkaloidigena]